MVLIQSEPAPSQVFVLRTSAKVEASGSDGAKLRLRPRIRMAIGDTVKLEAAESRVILVSLKTGRREELGGKGSALISADAWTAKTEKSKRLPDMDVAFLSRTFSSKTKIREKLGEVVRATESPIPVEVRRPMGAIPIGPTSITLASWQGVQNQKVTVSEGGRTIFTLEAKKGDKAAPLPANLFRAGSRYRWEVQVQGPNGLEKITEEFWPLESSLLTEFQGVLRDSGVFGPTTAFDPDSALAVVNRAMELEMTGIALDLMSAVLAKSPEDTLLKAAREQLIQELEAVK
jgi:hypothetical protein